MKYFSIAFFSFLILSCGGANVNQEAVLNPTNSDSAKKDIVSANSDGDINATKIKSKLKAYSTPKDIEEIMMFLTSDELKGRDTGSEGISKAADFIEDVFEENNIQPYFSSYRDTLENYNTGNAYNVVGFLPGSDEKLKNEYVIIGAHYDHIGL